MSTETATETKAIDLAVELGALTELPTVGGSAVWEAHRRGKNWMAAVRKDPTAPGGLAREFWAKARGDYFYLVPAGLTTPVAVEIGADYYTAGGTPRRRRWYGVIEAVAGDRVTVRQHPTAAQAINAAEAVAAERAAESLARSFKALTPRTRAIQQICDLMAEHGITASDL